MLVCRSCGCALSLSGYKARGGLCGACYRLQDVSILPYQMTEMKETRFQVLIASHRMRNTTLRKRILLEAQDTNVAWVIYAPAQNEVARKPTLEEAIDLYNEL